MNNNEEKLKLLKEAIGSNDLEFIGIDDSFGFECKQCGKCCMNREDIILNPFDVYNGAKHLGIDVFEFIKKYTYSTLGGQSKIPMLLLKTLSNGFCPLLKFDIKDGGKFKCIIHDAKPNACANHPIGVIRDAKEKAKFRTISPTSAPRCSANTAAVWWAGMKSCAPRSSRRMPW